jgi:electron transfer flavoprotein alpha/beta subunit
LESISQIYKAMKKELKELDVDSIGSQEPLSPAQQKMIEEYFAKRKKEQLIMLPLKKSNSRKKVKA